MFKIKSVLKTGVAMIFLGIFVLSLLNFKWTRTNASDSDYNAALNRMTQSSLAKRKAIIEECRAQTDVRLKKMEMLNALESQTPEQIKEMNDVYASLSERCFFTQPLN